MCVVFAIMAYFYTYIDPAKEEAQFEEHEPEDKKKRKSLEMDKRNSVEHRNEDRRSSDSSSDSSSDEKEDKQTKI